MKVTFISNYLNHHQIPFCLAMQRLCENNFYFISMEEMEEERKQMCWALEKNYEFEIKAEENEAFVNELIKDSDVVIVGGNLYIDKVRSRIEENKLTFHYSERILKKGIWQALSPNIQRYMLRDYTKYRKNKMYLLSASAYAPFDYSLFGAYKDKAYKWGYFPENKKQNIDKLLSEKELNSILWVARFIDWKHPEKALKLAKKLKNDGIEFKLRMIGNGVLEEKMKRLSKRYGLEKHVEFLGVMSPDEVRKHMEKSQIFLFTSDRGEGWGAVLNESMNSGCAVIADEHIGAAPYLVKDGQNGLLYTGSVKELYNKTKYLLQNPEKSKEFGNNAYLTIDKEWNANAAAERLFEISKRLINNDQSAFEDGPCSKAEII